MIFVKMFGVQSADQIILFLGENKNNSQSIQYKEK